jgi:hypothetical protein
MLCKSVVCKIKNPICFGPYSRTIFRGRSSLVVHLPPFSCPLRHLSLLVCGRMPSICMCVRCTCLCAVWSCKAWQLFIEGRVSAWTDYSAYFPTRMRKLLSAYSAFERCYPCVNVCHTWYLSFPLFAISHAPLTYTDFFLQALCSQLSVISSCARRSFYGIY